MNTITANGNYSTGSLDNRRYAVCATGTFDGATVAFEFKGKGGWASVKDEAGDALTMTEGAAAEVLVPGSEPELRAVVSGAGGSTAIEVEVCPIRR